MKIKFEPVRWMTGTLAIVAGLIAANETLHVLPAGWSEVLLYASMVLTVVLGAITRSKVTPLAAPRLDEGTPLVPKSMAGSGPRGASAGAAVHPWLPRTPVVLGEDRRP
jgi:hypothetical protein